MHSAAIVYSVEAGRTAVQAAITFGFVVLLGGAAGVVWTGLNQRRQLDLTSLAEVLRHVRVMVRHLVHLDRAHGRETAEGRDGKEA